MKRQVCSVSFLLICFLLVATDFEYIVADQTCKPSGNRRGKKTPPGLVCNQESDCCVQGKLYPTYTCSPQVSNHTNAILTLITFDHDSDYVPSLCDNKYHSNEELIVTLSTGWYDKGSRCLKYININANGRSVRAQVLDECDSTVGCDSDHDYQPPCGNNVVQASKGVWKALEVPESSWTQMDIYWSDT